MSCADVCLDHEVDGENAFYREKMVVARKQYKCCECGDAILPGALYQRVSGKSYDFDAVWTAKSCAPCAEIRSAFVCGSWQFGQLWESIREGMFPVWDTDGPIDCLAKLETIAARDKCRDEYRQWKQ